MGVASVLELVFKKLEPMLSIRWNGGEHLPRALSTKPQPPQNSRIMLEFDVKVFLGGVAKNIVN